MRAKDVLLAAIFPLIRVIAGIVRLVRQRSFALSGTPRTGASLAVPTLTAVALLVPATGLLLLAFAGDTNPLQLILPLLIDLGALALWAVAIAAWWLHADGARVEYAPGGDLTRTDLMVTLLLAATLLILALLDIGFTLIP